MAAAAEIPLLVYAEDGKLLQPDPSISAIRAAFEVLSLLCPPSVLPQRKLSLRDLSLIMPLCPVLF